MTSDLEKDAMIAAARERMDQIATMAEMLNGFRSSLILQGWDEGHAEHAVLMWWQATAGQQP